MTNNREEQIYKAADKATYQTPPQYSELVHKSRKVMCAYEVGFIDGCVWADQHPNWISVEDELPPKRKDPLVISDKVFIRTTGEDYLSAVYDYQDKQWIDVYNIETLESNKVTHWMPIVPPRKEVSNDTP